MPTVGTGYQTPAIDRTWSARADTYAAASLDRARKASADWAASATALLALVAIGGVFKGRETLEGLAPDVGQWLVILVIVTLVLSAASIICSALGAQGVPTEYWDTPREFQDHYTEAVRSSGRFLNGSRALTVLAFITALGATTLVWLGAEAAPTSKPVLFVGADGSVACGSLKAAATGIEVKTPEGAVVALPRRVVATTTVDKCP